MTPVHFVVLNEMMTGIVASQVIAPARCVAEALRETTVDVLFLEPARVALSGRGRARLRHLRKLWPGGRVRLVPYIGRLGPYSAGWSLHAALAGRRATRGEVFHARGSAATIQAARVAARRGSRVVFDVRGAGDAETVLRLQKTGRFGAATIERAAQQALAADQAALNVADAVSAISDRLAERCRAWPGASQKPFEIVPCCVDRPLFSAAARASRRLALGIADHELVCVHVSTEERWEAFDEVAALFRAIAARRPARLLFLSTLPETVVTSGFDAGDPWRDRILVRRVHEHEMPEYLSAGDVGLLIRQPHETFRAGNPIKFAEYLGAGLAIAVSEGIGSTADVVTRERVGVVLPHGDDTAIQARANDIVCLLEERDAVRHRAIEVCGKQFVWSQHLDAIRRLYGLFQDRSEAVQPAAVQAVNSL